MLLEKVFVVATFAGALSLLLSAIAYAASAMSEGDLTQFNSIFNSIGLGLITFGAGGILYVVANGG